MLSLGATQKAVCSRSITLFLEGLCSLASHLPSSELASWLKPVNHALLLRIRAFTEAAMENQLVEMLNLLRLLFVCTFRARTGTNIVYLCQKQLIGLPDQDVVATIEQNCNTLAQVVQRRWADNVGTEALSCLTAMALPFQAPCTFLSSVTFLFFKFVDHKVAPLSAALDAMLVLFSEESTSLSLSPLSLSSLLCLSLAFPVKKRNPNVGVQFTGLHAFLSELLGNLLQKCADEWTRTKMDDDPDTAVSFFTLLEEAEQHIPGWFGGGRC